MVFQRMSLTVYIVIYSILVWHVLKSSQRWGVFSLYTTFEYDFVPRRLCYLEERLAAGCMVPFVPATTGDILQCAIECVKDGSCVGCSRDLSSQAQPDGKLYKHWPCYRVFPLCPVGIQEIQYLQRNSPCQNGGQWNESVERCSCAETGGYVGEFCHRKAETCAELGASGYPQGQRIQTFAFPGYGSPFNTFCYLLGQWNPLSRLYLFQNPIQTPLIRNRTWAEYKTGFWLPGDYPRGWIGLENMVKILHYTKPNSVHLKLQVGNSMYVQTYFGFNLTEGTYALSYSSVSTVREYGTLPSKMIATCLSEFIGAKFSTWDQDNDDSPTMNCAAEAGGGWWYRFCNESCNLFLPPYASVNPEPISYTKIRYSNINLRYWAPYLGPVRFVIPQNLD